MDIKFFLKNLWKWKCGLPELNYDRESIMDMRHTQWSKEFEVLMRNRLVMGALRYGKLYAVDKKQYDRIESISDRLKRYSKDHNKEHLVDIANLCLLEFEEGEGTFQSQDDSKHTRSK